MHQVLRSPGQPLEGATRASMEARFGQDFARVRVHADEHAAQSARAVDAQAYTVGHNIVFGSGRYVPGTPGGQRLLAHELTHVVQQSGGVAGQAVSSLRIDDTGEMEAHTAAAEIADGGRAAPVARRNDISLQRDDASGGTARRAPDKSADEFYASLIRSGVSLRQSVEHTHWPSPQARANFIQGYLRYTRTHWLEKEYSQAIAAYPSGGQVAQPPAASAAPRPPARPAPPAIARLPYLERPVRLVQFKRLGFLGMTGVIMVTPHRPSIQTGPDPTAGYNFDTYLVNAEGGDPVPAQSLGGTRYRVLMGTPECPGCHFGRGIEIDLAGEHPLFIAGQMGLAAVPIAVEMLAAEEVAQLRGLAGGAKAPATPARPSVDPDISARVERAFQEHGGAAPKTITPSAAARPTPSLARPAQILESEGAAPRGRQFQSASAQTSRSMKTAIRADIGEAEAYKAALGRGEVGLERPGGANVEGTDFITAGREPKGEMVVYANDTKTTTVGKFPKPAGGPPPRTWQQAVRDAVDPRRLKLNNPKLEAEIRDAVAKGRVVRRQVNVNYSPAGQGHIEFK
ncbi:MAG: DUF4157 domain-containing protein [Bradyrhizobium sp.]